MPKSKHLLVRTPWLRLQRTRGIQLGGEVVVLAHVLPQNIGFKEGLIWEAKLNPVPIGQA
jgi:hypothetical protein